MLVLTVFFYTLFFKIMILNQNQGGCLKSFNLIEKLGEGSFASVYKVQRIDDKKYYALKKVKIGQMKQKQRDNALNQVRVLASISHPNIVNYKQAFFDDPTQSLCIVMELADAGDIQKKINQHTKNHTYFTQTQIWQALIQMAKGLRALHEINILHRDLKCANVFCTKDQKYKLGDMNVSKVAKRGMARTQTGTPYYTSPQVWKDRPYNSKCDIWSLGCVIYQMSSLSPPFRASNLKQLYSKIQRGIFQRIPGFYSEDLAQIVNQCLKVNPSARPSARQILLNPKIIKNTPISQKYAMDNDQTKKANLINTILCPRNLKSLKIALPGAKYQESPQKRRPNSLDQNRDSIRRAISARNNSSRQIQNEIPRAINSPKIGEIPSKQRRYGLQRRLSSQRNVPPLIQKKQLFSQNNQRDDSKNGSKNNSRLIRNNSVESNKKRQQSNRSNKSNKLIQNNSSSRRRYQISKQRVDTGKVFAENISNKCKNIKQRIEMLMGRKNIQPRYQKVSNSYQKRYNLPICNSKQKRNQILCGVKYLVRNNSNKSINKNSSQQRSRHSRQNSERRQSQRSLQRKKSIQRLERQNQRKVYQIAHRMLQPYRK